MPPENRNEQTENPETINARRYLRRRSMAGNWFAFFRDYLEVMSRDAALALQSIINLSQRRSKTKLGRKLAKKGWVFCTTKYLERSLKMTAEVQKRVLGELRGYRREKIEGTKKTLRQLDKAKAFIKTKMFGVPAKRYIWVDLLKIEQAIDKAKRKAKKERQGRSKDPSLAKVKQPRQARLDRTHYKEKGKKEKKEAGPFAKQNGQRASTNGFLRNETDPNPSGKKYEGMTAVPKDEFYEAGIKLRNAVRKAGQQFLGKAAKARDPFRLLKEHDCQDYKLDLDFFCANCARDRLEELGLPEINSANQFRQRYSWIRRVRMALQKGNNTNGFRSNKPRSFPAFKKTGKRTTLGVMIKETDFEEAVASGLYLVNDHDGMHSLDQGDRERFSWYN